MTEVSPISLGYDRRAAPGRSVATATQHGHSTPRMHALLSQFSLLVFVLACFTVELSIRSGVTGFVSIIASLTFILLIHGGIGLQARWVVPVYVTPLIIVTSAALLSSGSSASPLPTMAVIAGILPLSITIGYAFSLNTLLWDRFVRIYVGVSSLTALLAIWEHVRVARILGSTEQADPDRALVFVQHPIVLGLLLAVAIPLASSINSLAVRLVVVLSILAGVYSTGSSGPLAMSVILTFAAIAQPVTNWFARRPGLLKLALFSGVVVAAWLSVYHWTNVISDATPQEYSSSYRPALYSLLPEILAESPFGYGFSGLPRDLLFIYSNSRGISDVSVSIDAEPVLLASKFGCLGIAAYLAWIKIAIDGLMNARMASLSALGLLGCGLVVALTAWPQVAALLFVTLAFAYSSSRRDE